MLRSDDCREHSKHVMMTWKLKSNASPVKPDVCKYLKQLSPMKPLCQTAAGMCVRARVATSYTRACVSACVCMKRYLACACVRERERGRGRGHGRWRGRVGVWAWTLL